MLGSYQYLMKVVERDMNAMRDSVLRDLDPLTADLTTILVTKKMRQDYRALIRYIEEIRFPRSRNRSWGATFVFKI
jgi:hypothetical protein